MDFQAVRLSIAAVVHQFQVGNADGLSGDFHFYTMSKCMHSKKGQKKKLAKTAKEKNAAQQEKKKAK